MAKYVLLYSGGAAPPSDPAGREKVLQAWGSWFGKLGKSIVDNGNPFSDKIKTIASNGNVREGAAGQRANGYSIVEASSVDAATEMAKGCPVLASGGQVTVYETFNAM